MKRISKELLEYIVKQHKPLPKEITLEFYLVPRYWVKILYKSAAVFCKFDDTAIKTIFLPELSRIIAEYATTVTIEALDKAFVQLPPLHRTFYKDSVEFSCKLADCCEVYSPETQQWYQRCIQQFTEEDKVFKHQAIEVQDQIYRDIFMPLKSPGPCMRPICYAVRCHCQEKKSS